MKYFKSLMLLLALAFAMFPAFAQDTGQPTVSQELTAEVARMDDSKKAEVLRYVRSPTSESARKAQEWIDIGAGVGESLAATAGKLGVEVNKFATTPVGKMAMVLLIWHYMGEELSGWIAGIFWLVFFIPLWLYAARKWMGIYNEKGKFVRFDPSFFDDKSTVGLLPIAFIVSLLGIVGTAIVFIA